MAVEREESVAVEGPTAVYPGPCLVTKFKIPKKILTPAWRFKSRRNKKYIATAVCKWRDKSNEPN